MFKDFDLKKNFNNIFLVFLIILAFGIMYYCAVRINPKFAPDELFRVRIPYFIYQFNYLPFGTEKYVVEPDWGSSYAFVPYLPSLIAYVFMKIASLISFNIHVAMRLVSALSICGTIFVANRLGKELFKRNSTILLFTVLCGFLPQLIFIGSYFNNDAFSVFLSAIILFSWIKGIKTNWKYKYCILLGIALGCLTLTYYFAYGFILMSIPIFFISYYILNKRDWNGLIKKAGLIFLITFAISGWFFIRNYLIHNGDFLGFKTDSYYSELNALNPEFKPSNRITPSNLNESFIQAFIIPKGYFSWFESSAMSFIGYYGQMNVPMHIIFYIFYSAVFLIGLVSAIVFKWKKIIKFRFKNIFKDLDTLFIVSLICTIIIPLVFSLIYSYYMDYQAQGRYFISIIVPLMIFISYGYEELVNKINKTIKYFDINYLIIILYLIMLIIIINRYFWKLWL